MNYCPKCGEKLINERPMDEPPIEADITIKYKIGEPHPKHRDIIAAFGKEWVVTGTTAMYSTLPDVIFVTFKQLCLLQINTK